MMAITMKIVHKSGAYLLGLAIWALLSHVSMFLLCALMTVIISLIFSILQRFTINIIE